MNSNFDFLHIYSDFKSLAELASAAEGYAYTDPQAALVKLRCFTELFVGNIFTVLAIEIDPQSDLYTKINNRDFKKIVDANIVSKLHALRVYGNKAAHTNTKHSVEQTLWLIKEAYFVARWLIQTTNTSYIDIPEFVEPIQPKIIEDVLAVEKENQQLTEKITQESKALANAEAELLLVRQELVEAQSKITETNNFYQVEEFKEASSQAAKSFDLQMDVTRAKINIFDSFKEYSLTPGQSELVKELDGFLRKSQNSLFILNGYAGTGKTFITHGLTQYLDAIGRQFVLMAPTGKAAKVISDKTGQEASTIHRVIYNYEKVKEYKVDDLDGSETFRCYAEVKVNQHTSETVYIIDESSMVSDTYSDSEFFRFGSGYLLKDLLNYINLDHNDHTKKVIFIGDNAQLPPVGMNYSPALNMDYLKEKYQLNSDSYELTEVVRQKADSGIMTNAKILREALLKKTFNQLDFKTNDADVLSLDTNDLLCEFLKVCQGRIGNTKDSIIIASSNSQVSQYNRVVREHFFPEQMEVVPGDKIISVANHYVHEKVITNGEFGMVKQVLSVPEVKDVILRKKGEHGETLTIKVELCFRDVELGFRNENGEVSFFVCKIVENLLYNDEPGLSSDEHKALYVDFVKRHPELTTKDKKSEFRMALLSDPYFNAFKVKFGYAITCHKAQGSEWQNVFLKCSSHHKTLSQDYFRWLYTAITRTSSTLYVIGEPHIKLGSGMKKVSSIDFTNHNSIDASSLTSISTPQSFIEPVSDLSISSTPDVSISQLVAEPPSDPSFGIPENNTPLLALLSEIKSSLTGLSIQVVEITHNQYQEAYLFQRGDEFSTVRIGYTGKYKVTSIQASDDSELSSLITDRVLPLKGVILNTFSKNETDCIIELPEPFLADFHQRMVDVFDKSFVVISEVRARDYAQRYYFQKESNNAVFDIYYNGKSQFTKYEAKKALSNSTEFVGEVENIIAEALG